MAEKHYKATSLYIDRRDYELIKKIAARTHVSSAHFIREAMRSVVRKYSAFLSDEKDLDLSDYVAAPAHAALIAQRRDPRDTIQPHEGLMTPAPPPMSE